MAEPDEFELGVGRGDGYLVLAPRGDLDIASTPVLAEAFAAAAHEDVIFDLRAVPFIDSSGIRAILEAERGAREAGGRLRCVPGPSAVQRVLTLVKLDEQLEWAAPPDGVRWLESPD